MANYSLDNYHEIENIYLHDSELQEITINYRGKEVSLKLVTAVTRENPSQTVEFLFEQVSYIHVPIKEPWGSGFYIFSIEAELAEDNRIITSVILNSGDIVKCISVSIRTSD
ncbi:MULTISPECIES: hypothetical protein [unclassified Paenibacillus]|uniref:hypothetical protein n=1 Tax=unclassified Paenibacillus TaxID=185978 RepID=UPI0010456926|nr:MULTISPECIES: hypothetical protein [unclassified Paenibacillus]NIK70247.1 hypothetical protein [Paenibacillus sp. BK720]TCM85587.1 hypothetical protein EV294_1254 [Paenibacillus sp. BK033]